MQEETTIEYEVQSLSTSKVISRPDETTPYRAVEIRGDVPLPRALEELAKLHQVADEVVYRPDGSGHAILIYSRIPCQTTRPEWVITYSWTKKELGSFGVYQQNDIEPSLTLTLGEGKEFLIAVYKHNPYTKRTVVLSGTTDTATFLIAAHWFMLGGAQVTYTPYP